MGLWRGGGIHGKIPCDDDFWWIVIAARQSGGGLRPALP